METTYPNSHEEIIMEKNALLRIESYPSMLLLPSIINLYEKRLKSCIYEGLNIIAYPSCKLLKKSKIL